MNIFVFNLNLLSQFSLTAVPYMHRKRPQGEFLNPYGAFKFDPSGKSISKISRKLKDRLLG